MERGAAVGIAILLVLILLGGVVAMLFPWYSMTGDGDTFFPGRGNTMPRGDGEPAFPDLSVVVPLYGAAKIGAFTEIIFDDQEAGHIEQAMTPVAFAWAIGILLTTLTAGGLALRAAGLFERQGLVATLGLAAVVLLTFSLIHFGANVTDGVNGALNERYGESPDLAFFTRGGPERADSEIWSGVDSGPGLGFWAGLVTVLALIAALLWAYGADLRRLGAAIGDDADDGSAHERAAGLGGRGSGSRAGRPDLSSGTGRGPPRDFRERIRGGGQR